MTAAIVQHVFTPEQASKLRVHVLDQLEVHTQACIGFAKALFETYYGKVKGSETKLVEAWGFPDFDSFCEKELLWHGGTCRSYVRVYDELCVRRNFEPGELPNSITALRELAKISAKHAKDARKLGKWVALSKKHTACEFHDLVERELYGSGGRKWRLGFSMSRAARDRILKRIAAARDRLDPEGEDGLTNADALEQILIAYETGKPTRTEIRLRRAS